MKIAIYGLSTETERELPNLTKKYDVIGLLDGFRAEGELYGYPIISMDHVVNQGIKKIIVVARPGSCKAIAKRIGDICRQHEIELFDIRGKDILNTNKVVYDFKLVAGYKYAEIVEKIKSVEVVSFDLFDTLVMRNTLFSEDVIDLVVARLKENGIVISGLKEKRIAAEKELSQDYAPNLVEIYERVIEKMENCSIKVEQLANTEFEIDSDLLVSRRDSVKLLKEAKSLGKKVYITTDTYYSKEEIIKILNCNNIQGYDDVLVSCEYQTAKSQNLFQRLIEMSGTKNILHIGDDITSDINAAERVGIKGYQIYSGQELLDFVGGLGLLECIDGLWDRIRIGMFIAVVFNSPFQFESEEKKISVQNSADLGYLLFAPMICDFVYWFGQMVKYHDCKNIWFGARDGYLIKKIYGKLYPNEDTQYFLTSRIAAIRAGVENEKDIHYVDEMKFSGEIEENLLTRFGINVSEVCVEDVDDNKEGLLKYTKAILENGITKRENNIKYIENLTLKPGGIVFFDFVAKGTSQMYIQRMVNNPITGLYFLQLEPEYMKDKNLKIVPFYTEDEKDVSRIFENYYILETVITSPEPAVLEFDNFGLPVYASETRDIKDIECVLQVQAGIRDYIETYIRVCPESERRVNKKLCEVFLSLIHSVEIHDKDFLELKVEDQFFNRMTDVTDVI